ncbi:L-type lectin-domain containing receptor kinase IX.1 [Ziziphus jujuba]|uniref:non-specific serine/threonine protein kinase n=1 Tax=Ziziphus jujuba TaxID=326968 RepID=A0A6P3ZTB8_ZIZJJ|nr:L-type lectin-domain containing receptor kinase IX.1 [Ziziphus jujuba]
MSSINLTSTRTCTSTTWLLFIHFVLYLPLLHALHFNYPDFKDVNGIVTSGQANVTEGILRLTNGSPITTVGRAVYDKQVRLWDNSTGKVTDFTTSFDFSIKKMGNDSIGADGFAFFLAKNGSQSPDRSHGGCFGLISNCTYNSADGLVAVEFDTFRNTVDLGSNHFAIDVNSIYSVKTREMTRPLNDGSKIHVAINYAYSTNNFSVTLSFLGSSSSNDHGSFNIWTLIDIPRVMPEYATVGFAAGTGTYTQKHEVLSWEFNSTESPAGEREINSTGWSPAGNNEQGRMNNVAVVVGPVVGGVFIIVVIGLFYWRRAQGVVEFEDQEGTSGFENAMNREFDHNTGPRRYSYSEMVRATNNFAKQGLLGEGGFGEVYKGFLSQLNMTIAVKRVSKRSKQGRKEYISEVKIISGLRHRNLVKLMGWCHEKGELLLIYEFMPNGSLDSHLFREKTMLKWAVRYKMALGLASALLYLHEESDQSVIHRDIKSSNIMLDSDFNTKLGDFGLARLMDEDAVAKTTALAGTFGYMAPEYISKGKASKASDVYSFGVVALEIACGRKSIESNSDASLAAWVWEMYGEDRVVDVVDKRLGMEFEAKELECLVNVGLWCAHPDHTLRPSIRQALQVLQFEAHFPDLPKSMPPPNYNLGSLEEEPPVPSSAAAHNSLSFTSINVGR